MPGPLPPDSAGHPPGPGVLIEALPASRWQALVRLAPIAWLEAGCALAIALRAVWMLWPTWQSIPIAAQGYFIPAGISETHWGLILGGLAAAQAAGVWYRRPIYRVTVSTLIALMIGMTVFAYFHAGDEYRGVIPLILALLVDELLIATQAWTDWLTPPERRRWPRLPVLAGSPPAPPRPRAGGADA
jgi:hypothetical protein